MSDKNLAMRTEVAVKFNNVDISGDIGHDLISLTYTDAGDKEADDLKITLADKNNKWISKWLKKELENRDRANAAIKRGDYGAAGGGGDTYTVTAKIGLNVRAGRGTGYARIGGLDLGATVAVSEIVDGWATIQYGGRTAYVSAAYLKKSGGGTGGGQVMDGSATNNAKFTKVNAVIAVRNWDGRGKDRVVDCGSFELDRVSVSGGPQKVTMSATSLNYESAIRKTKKTRSWNSTTLKKIAEQIAEDGGYQCMYLADYDPAYRYVMQENIPDIDFLGKRTDAVGLCLKVTDGTLVIYDQKDNDKQPAVRTIRYGDGTYDPRYTLDSSLAKTAYASCHVSYEDENGNTYEATFTPATGYAEGDVLEVNEEVHSNQEAMELAKKRLRKENKGEMTAKFKLVPGDPRMLAGVNAEISGWGDFDGKWSVEKAAHSVSKSGYTTEIELSKVIEGY